MWTWVLQLPPQGIVYSSLANGQSAAAGGQGFLRSARGIAGTL